MAVSLFRTKRGRGVEFGSKAYPEMRSRFDPHQNPHPHQHVKTRIVKHRILWIIREWFHYLLYFEYEGGYFKPFVITKCRMEILRQGNVDTCLFYKMQPSWARRYNYLIPCDLPFQT